MDKCFQFSWNRPRESASVPKVYNATSHPHPQNLIFSFFLTQISNVLVLTNTGHTEVVRVGLVALVTEGGAPGRLRPRQRSWEVRVRRRPAADRAGPAAQVGRVPEVFGVAGLSGTRVS